MYVSLNKDKKMYNFSIHRLVAIHFIDNFNNKSEVNHIDGNKTNNTILNLEWVNAKENTNHSFKIGHPSKRIKLNVDKSFISNIENGKSNPTIATIANIAKALGISSEELIK